MSETTEELERLVADATEPQRDAEDGWDAANRRGEAQRELADMAPPLAAEVLEKRKALAPVTDDEVYAALSLKRGNKRTNRAISGLYREREALRKALAQAREAVQEVEIHCPCGARPESLDTHPHVGGCPVAKALAALEVPDGE